MPPRSLNITQSALPDVNKLPVMTRKMHTPANPSVSKLIPEQAASTESVNTTVAGYQAVLC
eukprot:6183272-Pleurochrysis_carterae.AAC.1